MLIISRPVDTFISGYTMHGRRDNPFSIKINALKGNHSCSACILIDSFNVIM